MNITNLMYHLQQLEDVAKLHNNSRAIEFGYNASVDYVLSQLATTNLKYSVQYFNVTLTEIIAPPSLVLTQPVNITYQDGADFLLDLGFIGDFSFSADVNAASNLGCNISDYDNIRPGEIVLIKRGVCSFVEKCQHAMNKSASAVVIWNDGTTPSRVAPFFADISGSGLTVPFFSLSFYAGQFLSDIIFAENSTIPRLSLEASARAKIFTTSNIIAETVWGDPNNVILIGSHLDSVPAGPGINDNGSGTSTNLELALQIYKSSHTFPNKIRFCWWGAEERGLLGSEFYVKNLSPAEKSQIAININLDMVGSPNFEKFIYNGTAAVEISPNIKPGSVKLMKIFQEFFGNSNNWDLTSFDGRSDYGPFIEASIPAGGLFTGAEEVKSVAGRAKYGGIASAAFDPCYHQSCDTVENINQEVLLQMAQASAHAVETLAIQSNLKEFLNSP